MRLSVRTLGVALVALVALLAASHVRGIHPFGGVAHSAALQHYARHFRTELLRPAEQDLLKWINADPLLGPPIDPASLTRGELFLALRSRLIRRAGSEARSILGGGDPRNYVHREPSELGDNAYPYWQFIPTFEGGVMPAQIGEEPTVLEWNGTATSCFQSSSATLQAHLSDEGNGAFAAGSYTLNLTVSDPNPSIPPASCSDLYLFATVDALRLQTVSSAGTTQMEWSLPSTASKSVQWDLATKGVRVFRFQGNILDMLVAVIDTALLFEGEVTVGISPAAAARNLDFLAKYSGFTMQPRQTQEVEIAENEIQSGDFFGIMRLDGMDPMLAWAMGSSTGHTTVALWIGEQLYICESTAKGSHWPVNGVQKTPYRTWLQQVKAAGQNAVHAPLTAEARAAFNESAALEWFLQQEGLDYGFHTLLWGWIDTTNDNYPCLPPDWSVCLVWETMEVVFGWADRWAPSIGDLLFNEAFNHRLGTTGLKADDLYMETVAQGYKPNELPVIVEQDDWQYNTTRYGQVVEGRSLVCCVFVCGMWKSAGVFSSINDEVNCGELTNWDDYVLTILDAPTRPQQCIDADPSNTLCQLEGAYSLILNDFATKAPYENMAQTCPSKPPLYEKPDTC